MHRSAAVFTVVINTVMLRLRGHTREHSRNLCLNRVFLPGMSVVYGPRNCTAEAAVDFAEVVVVVVRCHAACQEAAAAADTLEAS